MIKTFVTFDDDRWENHKIDFARVVHVAMRQSGMWKRISGKNIEISITLVNDVAIQKLNKQYRGLNKPTNVLSFETGDSELLGDIFIAYDTVAAEAAAANISFQDHAIHMVVHGVLHLMGYDHINDNDADLMEAAEGIIMTKLNIKNPYADDLVCTDDRNVPRMTPKPKWYMRLTPLWMILAGGGASFGFAPYYIGLATIIGFVLLYLFTYGRNGFWRGLGPGFWFGVGYGTLMFYWVLQSIFVDPVVAAQMKMWVIPGLIGIALGSGIVFGLPGAMAAATRDTTWRRVVFMAAFGTLILWMREWTFTGFPWNPIANITMPFPALANSMSLWGALGLSFIVLGMTFAIAHLVIKIKNRERGYLPPFLVFAPLLVVGIVWGHKNMYQSQNTSFESPIVRLVQPALAQSVKMGMAGAVDNLARLVDLSETDTGVVPDIIIWPETAYPFVVTDAEFPAAQMLNKIVIAGAMSQRDGKMYNSMIVANQDGTIADVYDKAHLVPFGEYQPFGKWIPSIGQLARGAGARIISLGAWTMERMDTVTTKLGDNVLSQSVDTRAETFDHDFSFAPAICYEILFSDSLTPKKSSPDFILNITNDTWFGTSHGPYQHLDMVRRYAIESGLPVARANYSGISAFVAADGRILSRLDIGVAGVLDGAVSGAHMTPYRRIGMHWMMIVILLFSACIAIPRCAARMKD